MHTVGVFETRTQLTALLDAVENGAEILITRRGRAIARLMPAYGGHDRAKARRAVEGLRLASRGLALDGLAIADLVREERR